MYCYQKKGNALFFKFEIFSVVKRLVEEEEKSDFGEKFPTLMAQQYLGSLPVLTKLFRDRAGTGTC